MITNLTILPEITIALAGILILIFGRRFKKFTGYATVLGILFSAIFLLLLASTIEKHAPETITIAEGVKIIYSVDLYAIAFKAIFLSIALIAAIASIKYMEGKKHPEVYYSLMLFAVLGMMVVASSSDLVTLFVGIEMAAIPSFILVAFEKTKKGIEGATKYFLFAAIFSTVMLLGILLIYISTGSFAITEISKISNESAKLTLFLGIIALFSALAFEMSAVPFHLWAPDTYQGAPTPISALLSGASKKMAFAAAIKILLIAIILFKLELSIMISILAIFSMIFGNIIALSQKDIKRMLAYSSIAQTGYILAAFAISAPLGIAFAIYYIIVHAFMKGGAFIAAASAEKISGGKIKNLEDYKGLAKKAPLTAFAMACFMLSLAGIVPFGGFTAKILILVELFKEAIVQNMIALILGVVMIITSVISLYYYGRLIKYMWFEELEEKHELHEHELHENQEKFKEPLSFTVPMVIAVIVLVVLFYAPPFIELAKSMVEGIV